MPAPRPLIARHMPLLRGLTALAGVAAMTDAVLAAGPQSSSVLQDAVTGVSGLATMIGKGLERQPSIVLAGCLATAVPLVALLAAVSRALAHRMAARHADRSGTASSAAGHAARTAWIEFEDRPGEVLRLGELLRIGRSEDCDLSIASQGLAEMHAVIQRSPENGFVIFDVSADAGQGLLVNGAMSRRHRLCDGDRIDLGHRRVIFRASEGWEPAGGGSAAI